MRMSELPAPLTPPDCDLRDFPFMPLRVSRLRDSEFAANVEPEAGFYAFFLWSAMWHQLPAASAPDDEATLTRMVGLGRDLKTFRRLRDGILYGCVKCSDGRLYHPVVAEQACEAWAQKLWQRQRTSAARAARQQRLSSPHETRPTDTVTDIVTEVVADSVTENVTASKGREGKGSKEEFSEEGRFSEGEIGDTRGPARAVGVATTRLDETEGPAKRGGGAECPAVPQGSSVARKRGRQAAEVAPSYVNGASGDPEGLAAHPAESTGGGDALAA